MFELLLMTETEQVQTSQPFSKWQTMKYRLGMTAGAGMGLVASASAAVNFTSIGDLIDAVSGLIPHFMTLVIEMAPLIVTISVIAFVVKFWDKILGWLNF